MVGRFTYDGVMDPNALSTTIIPQIHSQYLQMQGFASYVDYAASRKRSCKSDEVAVLFVLERHFRAFAQTGDGMEYCVLTEGDNVHAIAHELLHLFGAVDLYYPYHIYGLTMSYFPETIMCTYEGMEVDPLTQYLVGWTSTLTPKVREFMDKVGDCTLYRYYQANILEVYREREEAILQLAAPYASMADLMTKSAQCDPWAEYLMGLCYRDGIYLPQNAALAEDYFSQSGRTGLTIAAAAHAQMLLCRGVRTEQDRETLWLLLVYNSWNHMKLNSLHMACLLTGVGGKKDRKQGADMAVGRYQGEAASRYQHLAKRSAKLYMVAEKLCCNIPELRKVVGRLRADYDRMLESDDPDLQFILAMLLEEGKFVEKDLAGAVTLYDQAARGGNYRACQELARCCRNGIGTPRNPELARQWEAYGEACRKENPWDAFCRLL